MPKPRWDDIRFIFDEDARSPGLALLALRSDMTCVGSPPVDRKLPLGIKDPEWIPIVATEGWVVITKNSQMRTHPEEAKLAVTHGLRVACLTPPLGSPKDNPTRWELARMLLRHWGAVEQLHSEPGPLWLSVYESRTQRVPYEPGKVVRSQPGRL